MNISGPAAVAKPEMLFYAPGDLTVTHEETEARSIREHLRQKQQAQQKQNKKNSRDTWER